MFHLLLAVIYLSFISLGLPDGLLGAAWPTIYPQFDVPVSYAGIVSTIIAAGTVVSSLMSDRLTLKLGTGKITALSVLMTALALLGFSLSDSFWQLCLWAIPSGLGTGSVDASINNCIALSQPTHELAPLYVGSRRSHRPLCDGLCTGRWKRLAQWLSLYRFVPDITDRNFAFLSSPVEKKNPGYRICRSRLRG